MSGSQGSGSAWEAPLPGPWAGEALQPEEGGDTAATWDGEGGGEAAGEGDGLRDTDDGEAGAERKAVRGEGRYHW